MYSPPEGVYSNQLLIEIVDTLRIRYLVNLLIVEGLPILSVGETGIGKTLLMRNILQSLDESSYSYNTINLTPGTGSSRLQEMIERKLNRTTKKKFRPFFGKGGVVYLDNISLPKRDQFGYQPSLELIRFYLENGGWYDRQDLSVFTDIKKVCLAASMRERGEMPERLLNQFFLVSMNIPSE